MIIADYLRSTPDMTWDIALQSSIRHGVIRLPEDGDFDVTNLSHIKDVCEKYTNRGITPLIVEPLPNALHDHIKMGDTLRDESIEKFIKLMKNLKETTVDTVCFNFMVHYGWTRTATDLPERGGAKVTGFKLSDFTPDSYEISADKLWQNYEYFIRAVIPYAEKYGIKLALHPDDPPLPKLGSVARIFTSLDAIKKGINTFKSQNLGVTFCQACYYLMGEDLENAIKELADKIFFIHFRNVRGTKLDFSETFHDNGELDMARLMKIYMENGINVPIRVDHVPTLAGENVGQAGYDALGRLFAIGYLKGIIDALENC
ncbi:MAG: mannonate dehydratase [Clostridia bacterium]|nr:mannonate dehydratase [Clostridia bacterium]